MKFGPRPSHPVHRRSPGRSKCFFSQPGLAQCPSAHATTPTRPHRRRCGACGDDEARPNHSPERAVIVILPRLPRAAQCRRWSAHDPMSPSEPTCNSTKRRRASSPRVEARTWKMRLAPSRQEASSQKTSARSPFQAAARKPNEAPRRARFFLAYAKTNDEKSVRCNAHRDGFGISAPRAAFRLHIRTGSARRRPRSCAPPAGTARHGGCQSQTHTAAARDFAQTAPAAARHQRTRRPKLKCMIGTYGPPGRRAAILVTLAALHRRQIVALDSRRHARIVNNGQKSRYVNFRPCDARALLHVARA